MEEKKNTKWRAIAVCEAVLICVVLVVVAAVFLKNKDTKAVSGQAGTENPQKATEPIETKSVDNVKGDETKAPTAQEETTAQNVTDQPSTAAPAANLQKNEGNVGVAFASKSKWESGDSQFEQFELVLENRLSDPILAWEYKLVVPEDAKIGQYWGCTIEMDGQNARVLPVDYTTEVPANGQLENGVGITVEWKKGTEFDIASGEFAYTTSLEEETTEALSSEETKADAATAKNYTQPQAGTPVGNHGKLSVNGTDLVDEGGSKFQLQGVSTHGLAWFPEYVNKDAFKTLRDDYNANVVRLAMYTFENGGYCTDGSKENLKKLVDDGVAYATELGMYVIIDWHVLNDNNPNRFKDEAVRFFDEMSKKYADYENVIYEICNEPCGGTGWADIKAYAKDVIKTIRENDDDAVILVGTPNWSQDVDKPAADRLDNDENVMYTLHFYAATHKDDLRSKLIAAHKAGLPIFISEFSICDASGNGGIDYDSAKAWLSLINDYNLSYVGWSLCNKAETASLLKHSCSKTSGFAAEDLSDTGKWLFETFK